MKYQKTFLFAPPNLTGNLHLGHGIIYSIQHIIQNFFHMLGIHTDTLLGFDHGGIMTQITYNKQNKFDNIDEFVQSNRIRIIEQLLFMKLLTKQFAHGTENFYYTLDSNLHNISYKIFNKAQQEGLLKWKETIIPFDTTLKTALSDIEVGTKEIFQSMELIKYGVRWNLRYVALRLAKELIKRYLKKLPTETFITKMVRKIIKKYFDPTHCSNHLFKYIFIETTKPETILADRLVFTRFRPLVGSVAITPFGKKIPIFYSEEVKISSTVNELLDIISKPSIARDAIIGLKITPCCDKTDFILYNAFDYQKNFLNFMPMYKTNKLNSIYTYESTLHTPYLYSNDMYINSYYIEKHLHKKYEHIYVWDSQFRELIISDYLTRNRECRNVKSLVPIAKRSELQIFHKIDTCLFLTFNQKQKSTVIENIKRTNIKPVKYRNIMIDMVENFNEWCISRDVSWGMEVPQNVNSTKRVFDTWFTSCSIPHYYYEVFGRNIDTLITGQDILFFWVVRMCLIYSLISEQQCFKNIFFTGLIVDKDNQKMSKSKGNVVNPYELIEAYGVETFRLLVLQLLTTSDHTKLTQEKIQRAMKLFKKSEAIVNWIHLQTIRLPFVIFLYLYNGLYKRVFSILSKNNFHKLFDVIETVILGFSSNLIPKFNALKNKTYHTKYINKSKVLLMIKAFQKALFSASYVSTKLHTLICI